MQKLSEMVAHRVLVQQLAKMSLQLLVQLAMQMMTHALVVRFLRQLGMAGPGAIAACQHSAGQWFFQLTGQLSPAPKCPPSRQGITMQLWMLHTNCNKFT